MANTEKAQALLDRLHKGVGELAAGEDWSRALAFAGRFHQYSASNALLIWMQRPDATRVAGYRAWQLMGRQVRKHEHGIRILAPIKRKVLDEETGERVIRVVGWKTTSVFDVAQTDGDPLPELPPVMPLNGDEPTDGAGFELLAAWVADQGFQVTRKDDDRGHEGEEDRTHGSTRWTERIVNVAPDLTGAMELATLAHEVGHLALHKPGATRPESRAVREAEAESVGYVLVGLLGLDTSSFAFGDVTGWSGGDAKLVQQTAGRVLDAVSRIVKFADQRAGGGDRFLHSEGAA